MHWWRIHEIFADFFLDETRGSEQHAIRTNDFQENHLAEFIAFLFPFTWQVISLRIRAHEPTSPLFAVMHKSTDNSDEIGQFVQLTNSVPDILSNPVRIRIQRLVLDFSGAASAQEELVFVHMDVSGKIHSHLERQ